MADIKWSAFPSTTATTAGDSVVGLHSGANERFLVSAAPSASGIALWDANSNLSANNTINGYATTATAAGTTTLTVASKYQQYFTGSTTQTVQEANTSTLTVGYSRMIVNNSSGNVTVNASDGSLIQIMTPNTVLIISCTSISITSNAAWNAEYVLNSLAPTLANTGIILSGNLSDSPYIGLNYTSAYLLGTYYPNLLTAYMLSGTLMGYTTIDLGRIAAIYPNGINVNGDNQTSIIGNSVLFCFALALNSPSLTTVSLPALISNPSAITVTAGALATLSLPSLVLCGPITLTTATILTTLSFPALIYLYAGIAGTANALTTLTLTNVQVLYGSYTLTANALTTLSMPALLTIGKLTGSQQAAATFTPAGTLLATINMPLLTSISGTFNPTLAALTSLTLTNLATIGSIFSLTAATLTTLSLPALATMGGNFSPNCALATTVTLTSLANITGTIAASFPALATLSLPALVSVSSTFTISAANLVTFSMGATLKSIGGYFTMTGMKLNQASVDGILVSLAALDGTNGTTAYSSKVVNLSGGTSSTPSVTGLAAKAILVARGCVVTTN